MMTRTQKFLMGVVPLLSLAWGGCIIEEETAERERFEDDPADVDPGAGGSTGSGALETTVSTGTGSGGNDGSGSSGAGANGSGSSGSGNNNNQCDYSAPNSCLSADTITEIAGDDGEDVRVISGTTERFVKVFVKESVGAVYTFPDLRFAAQLENSAGMDFDLFVYAADDEPHCDAEAVEATTDPAVVVGSWGDSLNSDDGRWIVFEIVYAGGEECGSNAEWTLTIVGNCDTVDCFE